MHKLEDKSLHRGQDQADWISMSSQWTSLAEEYIQVPRVVKPKVADHKRINKYTACMQQSQFIDQVPITSSSKDGAYTNLRIEENTYIT